MFFQWIIHRLQEADPALEKPDLQARASAVFAECENAIYSVHKSKFDQVPVQIHLSDLGFCCLIFTEDLEANVQTEVVLTNFAGRPLARKTFEGRCTAAEVIVNSDICVFGHCSRDGARLCPRRLGFRHSRPWAGEWESERYRILPR
jgi:hypothetical protein